MGNKSSAGSKKVDSLGQRTAALVGVAAAAGAGVYSLTSVIGDAKDAASSYQNAMAGLVSIAGHFGVSQTAATKAAKELARDGLMTVTESAKGLKNLLASGFNLEQSIVLMNRFKDSAAFNRQASLGFGEAIASATEGIKNGNSILVDNAGVTKNLSMILTEAGFSAQDLMKATTDAGVRQALFNGIVKETAPMLGNAASLAKQFAGEEAKASAETITLKTKLGEALQPALLSLMKAWTPVLTGVREWVTANPQLAAGLVIGTALFFGLAAAVGAVGIAMIAIAPLVAVVGGPVLALIMGIGLAVSVAAGLILANWGEVSSFLKTTFDWIGKAFIGLVNGTVDFAQSSSDAVLAIPKAFEDAGKAIAAKWAETTSWVAKTARDLWDSIGRAFQTGVQQTVQFFQQLPMAIAYGLGYIAGALTGFVTVAVPAFITGVINWFAQLPGAIGGFVQGVYVAVTNWFAQIPGAVTGSVASMYGGVVFWFANTSSAVGNSVSSLITNVINWFNLLPGRVGSAVASLWSSVVGGLINFKDSFIKWAQQVIDSVVGVFNSLPQKINEAVGKAVNSAKNFMGDVGNNISKGFQSGVGAFNGHKNALGTNFARGGRTLVGEMGPEIIDLPQGSKVMPAYRTRQEGSGGGGPTVVIQNMNVNNGENPRRIFEEIGFALELAS